MLRGGPFRRFREGYRGALVRCKKAGRSGGLPSRNGLSVHVQLLRERALREVFTDLHQKVQGLKPKW